MAISMSNPYVAGSVCSLTDFKNVSLGSILIESCDICRFLLGLWLA